MYEVNSIKMESSTYSLLCTLEYALQCTLTAFSVEDGNLNVQLRLGQDAAAASQAGSDLLQTSCLKCSSVTGMITENKIHKNCGQCGKTVDERIGEVSLVLKLTNQDDKCQCCPLDSAEQELKSSTVCKPSDPTKMISNIEVDKSSTKTDKPNSKQLEMQSEFCVRNLESQSGNKDRKIRLSDRFQLHKSDKASGGCDRDKQLTFKSVTLVNAHMNGPDSNPELQYPGDQLFEHGRNLPQHMKSYVTECTDKPNLADHDLSPHAESEPVPCNQTVTRSTNTSRNKMRSVLRQRGLTSSHCGQGFERKELRGTHTSHRQEQHQCPVCEVSHITRAHLRKHMEDHSDSDRRAYNMSNRRRNIRLDASLNGENMILLREKISTPVNGEVPTPLSGENPAKITTGLDTPLSGENHPKINTGLDTPLSGENYDKINKGFDPPLSGQNPAKINKGLDPPLSGQNPAKINAGLDTPLSGENPPKINAGLDTPLSGQNPAKINTGLDRPLSGQNPAKRNWVNDERLQSLPSNRHEHTDNAALEEIYTILVKQEIMPCSENVGTETVRVKLEQERGGFQTTRKSEVLYRHKSDGSDYKEVQGISCCNVCDKFYKTINCLKMHQETHKKRRVLKDLVCGEGETRAVCLKHHEVPLKDLMYKCNICSMILPSPSPSTLEKHKESQACANSLHNGHERFPDGELVQDNQQMCGTECGKDESTVVCVTSETLNVGHDFGQDHIKHNSSKNEKKAKRRRKFKTRLKNKDMKCEVCDAKYSCLRHLQIHQKKVHGVQIAQKSYQCHVCGETFSSQAHFDRHADTNCTYSEKEKQKCSVCGKVLSNVLSLEKHMHVHTEAKSHMCDVCGKCFLTKRSLDSHRDSHQDYRPHICDICGRKYRNVWHMKNHRKVHTGENLLQCKECKDWFINASYLKNQHPRYCKAVKQHICQTCTRVFRDGITLQSHAGLHTGERPFDCVKCGKAFTKQRNLTDHLKRHFEELDYKCSICGKGFKRRTELRKHEKRHAGGKGTLQRYTLGPEMKPKEPLREAIITDHELDQATVIKSHPVILMLLKNR
ncbi:uncharacterized protein LOC124151618 [Haliotis rufescens]|uniref:uncharacterized protein LOC124151618 n=1 Tax=Haliotis rufescens TaxID=6454 RepID=UPI00201E90D6|nr:uncharacterized protein LOC124151618 [Haliotis rufescens]